MIPRPRTPAAAAAAVLVAALGLAAPAAAKTGTPPPGLPAPPLQLPAPGKATARAAGADTTGRWLVAGRRDVAARLASRYGAQALMPRAGIYGLPAPRARAFAAALRAHGALSFAEPDRRRRPAAFPSDPFTNLPGARADGSPANEWWLYTVLGDPNLRPPAVTSKSPLLVDIDTQVQLSHPEFKSGGSRVSSTSGTPANPNADPEGHGTSVIAVAAAPRNDVGIVGLWPGMRALVEPSTLSCADIVRKINAAINRRAAVLNMSYGGSFCYGEYVALETAFGVGTVLVASAGNDFGAHNPVEYPAAYPHVVSVAATTPADRSADFSEENGANDVSAPGEDILTAVPTWAYVGPGPAGGGQLWDYVDGTSYSAPIVSAAAAWIRAVRPELTNDQVAGVIDDSATDLGPRGWDQRYGAGLLNLSAALRQKPRPVQVNEPNDDIPFINGVVFRNADPPLFAPPRRHAVARSTLDQWEDPDDVYRVFLPPRRSRHTASRVLFKVTRRFGDPDLYVYSAKARTIRKSGRSRSFRHLLKRSTHRGGRADQVVLTNRSRRRVLVYVDVTIDHRLRQLDAGYRLGIKRLR